MSLLVKAKRLEQLVKEKCLGSQVWFYDSQEEFNEAKKSGEVGPNDVCFIDDVYKSYDD